MNRKKLLQSVLRSAYSAVGYEGGSTATKDESKKRGSVITLALFVVVILSVMGVGLLSLGLQGRILAIRNTSDIIARRAADAGLTKAVFEMNEMLKNKLFTDNMMGGHQTDSNLPQAKDETLLNCDATFSYTVTADANSVYTIESIGKSGQAEREINSTLRLQGLFEYAIFVVETINMKNNTLVDGYNSNTGETNVKVQIGTLSTAPSSIILGSGIIDGDVVVGVGGDPETVIDSGGTITGETYALREEYVLPSITPPTLPDKGVIDVQGTTILLSPADNGKYTGITSLTGGILEIDGGDVVLYVTGDIDMDDSDIRIKDGSSLTLYADGNIIFKNGAGINNLTGVCANLKIYSTGGGEQIFELKNNSDAFGVIYAPNTDISLMNNANLHGSFTSKSFSMMNNGAFYYDAALRDVSINDEAVSFVVSRWSEE